MSRASEDRTPPLCVHHLRSAPPNKSFPAGRLIHNQVRPCRGSTVRSPRKSILKLNLPAVTGASASVSPLDSVHRLSRAGGGGGQGGWSQLWSEVCGEDGNFHSQEEANHVGEPSLPPYARVSADVICLP